MSKGFGFSGESDERYLIEIDGDPAGYYHKYVKSFGYYLDTTDDIYSAKFFKVLGTAQKQAEKIRKHIKKYRPAETWTVNVIVLHIEIEGIVAE